MNIEQPQAESMADRIANQFDNQSEPEAEAQPNEQPETDAEAEAEVAAPEIVEVEFGGKSYQVPPELKDALMAQKDYTTKTQEIAEQRRLVEVKAQQLKQAESERAFHGSVKDDILAMQKIDFQIDQYKSVDATGLTSDQLWQLSRTIDNLKDERAKMSQKVTDKYGQWQQEQQKLSQEAMSKAHEAAAKAIPNWSADTQKQLRDYAASEGFAPNEVENINDPRVVKILWKAAQFSKLQAAKITGKVTTAPAVKPGSSNPMAQGVKQQLAFKKEIKAAPTSAAKARAIEKELMRRFQ